MSIVPKGGEESLADVFHRLATDYIKSLEDEWSKAMFEMQNEGYAADVDYRRTEATELYEQCMKVWAAFNLTLALCPDEGIEVQSFRDMQHWVDQYVARNMRTSAAGHMALIFAQCWSPLMAIKPAPTVH